MRRKEPPSRGSPNWSNLSHTSHVHPTMELLPRNRNPNLPTHPPLDPPDPIEATPPPPTPTHHWHRSLVSFPRSTLAPAPQPRLHDLVPSTLAPQHLRRPRPERDGAAVPSTYAVGPAPKTLAEATHPSIGRRCRRRHAMPVGIRSMSHPHACAPKRHPRVLFCG